MLPKVKTPTQKLKNYKYLIQTLSGQFEEIEKLSRPLKDLKVNEIKNPELSAYLVAGRIASDLERRMPQRRVVAKTMERVMASGAKGIKIFLSGRVGGAEISRVEKYHAGSVSTQTLRENIDYAQVPALLKKGYVGVKVWISKDKEEE